MWFKWCSSLRLIRRKATEMLICVQTKIVTEWYVAVVLSIMLYKVAETFKSMHEIIKSDRLDESYWAVLSCGIVCYVAQGGFMHEFIKRHHSNESCWAVLSWGIVRYAVQSGPNSGVCGCYPKVWPFKWKLLSSTFPRYCSLFCTKWS